MSENPPPKVGFHGNWAAFTAGLAVVVGIAGLVLAYSNRTRTHELAADMTVKNISRDDAKYASWADAVEGDVVEYRVTVKNIGSSSLSEVKISFDPPGNRSMEPVAGACWFEQSQDKPRASCTKGWNERALQTPQLRDGDVMTMVARFRVARPSCRRMLPLTNTTTADSAETSVKGPANTTVRVGKIADLVPNSCDSLRAQLLFAIPTETRDKCSTWEEGALGTDRVACYPKAGMQFAVYAVFRSRRAAEAAYRGVRLGTSLTACGVWKKGRGSLAGGNDRTYRFKCSDRSSGASDLYWIEPKAHVVGYAHVDGQPDANRALAWWRSYG